MIEGRIVKNFSLLEMMNKQTEEEIKLVLSPDVVEHAVMLQELRDWYGKPMNVSSWYRAPKFNKAVGGASNSCHLDGLATDINNIPQEVYGKFVTAWQVICNRHNKIGGIELYTWGMHFDSDSGRYGTRVFRIKDNRKK